MPRRQAKSQSSSSRQSNSTLISPSNIIDGADAPRATRAGSAVGKSDVGTIRSSRQKTSSTRPNSTLLSASNILDGADAPRATRQGPARGSLAVRTTTRRQEVRHDPMTRADRGARTQRTTKGKKSKSKKKSKRKPTRATRDDEEEQATDALDSSNPGELPTAVSSATDAPAQPSEPDVNVQAESDGNTGRLADDGSTAIQESPKLPPQEPTTDQDEAAEGHANALATRTRDALINAASAALSRPGRGSSPAPNENRGEPSSAAPPSNMVRIVTYPNGLSQPPLIQYTTSPAPIPTTTTTPRGHRAASPAPEDHFRRSRSPSAPPRELPPPTTLLPNPLEQTVNLPRLPLPPTPDRPGLALQPPSRDHSPSEDPVLVVHQPPGFGYLVPRVGGYREGSIDRWPVLPDRRLRQMSDAGLEVRGETIYWKRAEGEEEEEEVEGEEEDMDIDGDEEMEMEEVGGQDGVEQREMKGIEEDESEESEVGDPANMTLEELDEMMKDF